MEAMDGTPKLIILSEQFRGRTFELTNEIVTIGRVDERDICIKDPTVSTNHCTLIRRDNTCFVRDDGSTNGTRVNSVQLEPGVEQELLNTDVLQVGGIEMLFDSDDKSVTTVMRTTTDININANEGTRTIDRIDAAAFARKKTQEKSQKVFIMIIVLLSILLVGMAVMLFLKVMDSRENEAQSAGAVTEAAAEAVENAANAVQAE